jgi:hypothetical protein
MGIYLTTGEGDLLARMSAEVRQQVTDRWTDLVSLDRSDRLVAGRLVSKGMLEQRPDRAIRITQAGVNRAKSVY